MRIARSFIDTLLTRVDIVELIESYVHLRKAGRNHIACCPFHLEKTPSFTVNQDKQFYHCFGCGVHGNAITFLMEYTHLNYVDAIHELAARAGVSVEYDEKSPAYTDDHRPLYDLMQQAARYYQQQLRQPHAEQAVAYLKRRGLTGMIAKQFGIGYAPAGWQNLLSTFGNTPAQRKLLSEIGLLSEKEGQTYDRFRDRIMFPIQDYRGRIIAFGGRVLDNSEPKYLNSPETPIFKKSQTLYGLYHARQQRNLTQIIVVEGYFDVIALTQYEIHHAVASLGTALTAEHISRLFRSVSDIIFCFDGDRAGREAAWRAVETTLPHLQNGRRASFAFLPPQDDPDSLVRKVGKIEFLSYIQAAIPLSDFLFNHLSHNLDLQRAEDCARLVHLVKPLLAKIPDETYRELLHVELKKRSGVELTQLPTIINSQLATKPVKQHKKPSPPPSFLTSPSIERVIECLLQNPALSREIPLSNHLSNNSAPELQWMLDIYWHCHDHPDTNIGVLYERWRDTDYAAILQKLTQKESFFNTEIKNLAAELQESLALVEREYRIMQLEEQYTALLNKDTLMTESEKHHFAEIHQELRLLKR